MIADDSMHVVGVPMDTLGTEIRYRYNRRHALPPRVDRIGYDKIGYWRDDFFKSMSEEENKNDNDIDNDSENEGGTN